MAAVATEKKNLAAKYESAVDEQLAQATSRIRFHDLTFGGLLLVALLLVYATAMILLDRYLVLPEWVRQLTLAGFLAAAAGTTYWTIVRPLRRRVNPLYAAVQVEKTIEDAKNSVAGYVEAQEKGDVHPAVRSAMGARAAKSLGGADVNRAVDHRTLVYAGAVAVVFLLALVVLFFIFRPAQFVSLVGRTFAPFSADPIANRTQLTLTEPTGGDTTVTAGQAVTVKVQVGGKIPPPDSPDRVRVLIRHNPAAPEYDELAMETGENSREWQARIPDHLVRNGFWYKVAGGDAATPEYKVTVRSLPYFTEFEVGYEYPPYTRRAPEPVTKGPHVEGYRGTKVTVTGKTNRAVKEGRIVFEPAGRDPVNGTIPADRPDALRFQFYLTTSGTYKAYFTSTEGERSTVPTPFEIRVIEDEAPKVDIISPEDDEVAIPANGQLAVDARIGDDFGIDRVRLKLQLAGAVPQPLADRPYHEGKSFRRDADGTWPTTLDYKDSVDFTRVTDAAGQKVELKEGMILEYWLEATDNRSRPGPTGYEPDPNIGRSRVKKVRIAAPVTQPEQQEKQDARKQDRRTDEQKHNQAQQHRLDTERRDPKPNPGQQQPPDGPKDPEQEAPKPAEQPESGMEKPPTPPEPKKAPMPGQERQPGTDPMPKKDPDQPPMMPPGGMPMADPGMNGGTGEQNPTAPPPSEAGTAQQKTETQKQAEQVRNELNRESQEAQGGGSAKSGPAQENERTNPGEPKPPMPGEQEPTDPPKEGPKPNDPGNPMTAGAQQGNKPEKPEGQSDPKPDPGMTGQPGGAAQGGAKNQKTDTASGADKETPKPQPSGSQDQAGGGMTKPATEQKPQPGAGDQPMTGSSGTNTPQTDAAKPKPMPKADPGMDREPAGNPMSGSQPNTDDKPNGGAKPQRMPEASAPKPTPNETNPMTGGGEAKDEPKPGPSDTSSGNPMTGSARNTPDQKTPMTGGKATSGQAPDQSRDKPRPEQNPMGGGQPDRANPNDPGSGSGGEQRKLDPKQEQELKKAVNDLTSKDANKRKAAQDKLDQMVGEQNRKEIEDIAKGLNSKDEQERAAAEKKLNDLKEQMEKKAGGNSAQSPRPDPKDVDKALNDLKSQNPQTRDAAKEKLDKMLGQGTGRKAEDAQKDLQSDDQQKRDAGRQKLDDLKKQADQMAKGGGTGPKKGPNDPPNGAGKKVDPKEVEKAFNDLKSNDQQTRDAAKQKLDETFGKGAGQKAEDFNKELNSDDPETRKAAQQKLDDLKKQADQMAQKGDAGPRKGPNEGASGAEKKVDPKEMAKAFDDLNSNDRQTREAAKQKLDETFGKGAGQAAEDLNKDLRSDDPQKREAAQQKLNDLKKQADQMAQKGDAGPKKDQPGAGKKVDPKEVEKALNDLGDPDPKKREAAKEKLDETFGKGAGQKAEENNKKLNSGNLEEEARARNERDQMLKQAEDMAKNGQNQPRRKELSPKEVDDLAKKAEDLNSQDATKRAAAEKELDRQIGEENRKRLQEEMKNRADNPGQQAEDLRKQLDEMAKKPTGPADSEPDGNRVPKGPPGSAEVKLKEAMKEDARNRAKSAELQLEQFEKNKSNKDLLDRLGWNEAQYEKFLDDYRKETARLKVQADEAEKTAATTGPVGPPARNVSGGGKIDSRNGASGTTGGAGTPFAAPGFSDAMRKFQTEASKLRKNKQ